MRLVLLGEGVTTKQLIHLPRGDFVGGSESIVGAGSESILGAGIGGFVGTTMSCMLQVTPDQQYFPGPHSACWPVRQCISKEHSFTALM